jgi:hypothetical protein
MPDTSLLRVLLQATPPWSAAAKGPSGLYGAAAAGQPLGSQANASEASPLHGVSVCCCFRLVVNVWCVWHNVGFWLIGAVPAGSTGGGGALAPSTVDVRAGAGCKLRAVAGRGVDLQERLDGTHLSCLQLRLCCDMMCHGELPGEVLRIHTTLSKRFCPTSCCILLFYCHRLHWSSRAWGKPMPAAGCCCRYAYPSSFCCFAAVAAARHHQQQQACQGPRPPRPQQQQQAAWMKSLGAR